MPPTFAWSFLLGVAAFLLPLSARAESPSPRIAHRLYASGDCKAALPLYRDLLRTNKGSSSFQDEVLLRISYCLFKLERYAEAELGFAQILSKYPNHHQARLKHSESFLLLGRPELALKETNRVRAPAYLTPSRILASRSHLELGEASKAIEILNSIQVPGDLDPEVSYWKGVAYYSQFEVSEAEAAFQSSFDRSKSGTWTRAASSGWINALKDSRRTIKVRGSVGYVIDTNIAQLTYSGSGTPENIAGEDSYLKDHGYSVGLKVETKPWRSGGLSLVPSLSMNGTFYRTNTAYDTQSLAGQLTLTQILTRVLAARASVSFIDTRYRFLYYQDYLILNASLIVSPTERFSAHFSSGFTRLIKSREAWVLSPTVGWQWELPWASFFGTIGLTRALGLKAQIDNATPFSVTSGFIFSRYSMLTGSAGIGETLPWEIEASLQISLARTWFDDESVPAGAAEYTTPRGDHSLSWHLSLYRPLWEKKIGASIHYSYLTHHSDGFQGIRYANGASPNYNYRRHFASFLINFAF